jgi:hypothetical protein
MDIEKEIFDSVYEKIWSSSWARFYDDIMKECGFTCYNDVGNHVSSLVRESAQRMTDALRVSVSEYEYR